MSKRLLGDDEGDGGGVGDVGGGSLAGDGDGVGAGRSVAGKVAAASGECYREEKDRDAGEEFYPTA